MTSTDRVWLTPEADARLHAELTALLAPADPPDAGDDTTTDDGPARAARIRQLRELLAAAVVGQDPPDDGIAEPGMVLTVRYADTGDEETFLLGLRVAGHPGALEIYSPSSPLGRAVTGARPGDRRSYRVPDGSTVSVTLLRAVPYSRHG